MRPRRISRLTRFGILSGTVLLAIGSAAAEDRPVPTKSETDNRTTTVEHVESSRGPIPAIAPMELFPIPAGTVFERHSVGGIGATAGGEHLIYSNTLGAFAAALGANRLVADDIAITAPNGCRLRRYEFPVVGKVDPNGLGGPYTVDFALYANCPGSVPTASRPALIVPGTQGQGVFLDEGARLISFVVPDSNNVSLNTNFWLGVKFSRNNAGVVFGAPAFVGFSADNFDYPGFACDSYLGGFPDQPQASFNAEIYGDADCPEAFVGYKNNNPGGSLYNPGAAIFLADDIQLGAAGCNMIAYEVAVRGVGFYEFRMSQNCESGVIAGTEGYFSLFGTNDVRIARFAFDPPIPLPQNFWFATKVGNYTSSVVISGQQAGIGETADLLETVGVNGCNIVPPDDIGEGIHGAFNLAITCAGPAPVGACCDMIFTDEYGDAVCRQLPLTNCPYPERFSTNRPAWVEGEACEPDPFSPQPCGVAACCTLRDGCLNLTLNECNALPPLSSTRQWQRGQYCNSQQQRCPRIPCLGRTGECTRTRCTPNAGVCNLSTHTCTAGLIGKPCTSNSQCHCPGSEINGALECQVGPTCCDSCAPVGCEDPECCTRVCDQDVFCCEVEWDQTCADEARQWCGFPHPNDVCAPEGRMEGARLMTTSPPGNTAESDSGRATESPDDPGFGCYLNDPGRKGLQTVWYKFVATHTKVLLQTCASNATATDSLLEVFAVGDDSTPITQCDSLIPVGCGDDFPGCSSSGKNSKVCVRTIPGELYYVMVASKVALLPGTAYRLDITGGAVCELFPFNDYCPYAFPITDGTTPFNLSTATMTPPVETCVPPITGVNDLWYKYTATCSGTLTVEACGAILGTTTNLAIYEDCLCPPISGLPIDCRSALEGPNCGPGSELKIDAVEGNCYGIRLADDMDNRPSGSLKISCVQADCPAGPFTFTDPPNGVVDARRPYPPENPSQLEGIQTIKATGPRDALPSCFTLCETATSGAPNSIANIAQLAVEDPPGTFTYEYTITLARPITAGAKTTIRYTDLHGGQTILRLVSHPGNVRGDAFTNADDLAALVAAFQSPYFLPFGLYSGDINHSGAMTPADILEEVDLLNDDEWNGTANPIDDGGCP